MRKICPYCHMKLVKIQKQPCFCIVYTVTLNWKYHIPLTVLILGISKSGGDPPPLHKMWGGAKNSGGRHYGKV